MIENLYDFDLGIITITIDEREWLAPSNARVNGEWRMENGREKQRQVSQQFSIFL